MEVMGKLNHRDCTGRVSSQGRKRRENRAFGIGLAINQFLGRVWVHTEVRSQEKFGESCQEAKR